MDCQFRVLLYRTRRERKVVKHTRIGIQRPSILDIKVRVYLMDMYTRLGTRRRRAVDPQHGHSFQFAWIVHRPCRGDHVVDII